MKMHCFARGKSVREHEEGARMHIKQAFNSIRAIIHILFIDVSPFYYKGHHLPFFGTHGRFI